MKVEPRHVCEVRVKMTDLPKLKPNIHIPERLLEFCEMEAKIDKLEAEVERLKGGNKKLHRMIEEGINFEDLENDITYP